ncbi:MAG: hypothetical protein PHO10_06460 [Gemmiger sp.]|nr:hypothetical protein [Gemmiger sp.]
MKNDPKCLTPILLLGLLMDLLLSGRAVVWTRLGVATALLAVLLLGALCGAVYAAWRYAGACRWLRLLFAALLVLAGATQLLRLNALYRYAYPGATSLLGIGLAVLLPVLYLRQEGALAQTGNIALALFGVGCLLLVGSTAARLRITNLQGAALGPAGYVGALQSQLWLYPEYLLPAVLYGKQKKENQYPPFKLPLWGVLAGVASTLLLELLFGAALPSIQNPAHTAAAYGQLSVFNRLEWVQLMLWTVAVVVKLALYLYAIGGLVFCYGRPGPPAATLGAYAGYGVAVVLLAALLQVFSLEVLVAYQEEALLLLAVVILVAGGVQCGLQKTKRQR